MTTPEIEELKTLIEERYGHALNTSTDFEEFSLYVSRKNGKNLSASTLKRLWAYVGDTHKPRICTLDTLAQLLDHKDYHSFTMWLKTSTRYNSLFFNANQVLSDELTQGTKLEIGWSPNRILLLRYLGNSMYEVVQSTNSKILPGDRFVTGCFIKNYPLYLPYIERNNEHTSPFVAGRNGGLTVINVKKQ